MATYKFNRTTNGPVRVTTTANGVSTDEYYSNCTNIHVQPAAGRVLVCLDISRLILPAALPSEITEINATPFAGTLAQAITALGETVFY